MTRLLWAACSALTLMLVVAAAAVDESAAWVATPVAALCACIVVLSAGTLMVEARRHARHAAARRHPSHWVG